jgi:polar amino acid transport system substrate-binding protein
MMFRRVLAMQKLGLFGLVLCAGLALFAPTVFAAELCDREIRIGWINVEDTSKDRAVRFADLNLVEDVVADIGCTSRFVNRPWARLLDEVAHGTIDILPTSVFSEERAVFAEFSAPYREVDMFLGIRRADLSAIDPTDLQSLADNETVIARLVGQVYSAQLEEAMKQTGLADYAVTISKMEIGMRMLAAGRVDALMADSGFLNQHLMMSRIGLSDAQRSALAAALMARIDGKREATN